MTAQALKKFQNRAKRIRTWQKPMMSKIILWLILFYKSKISPHKGYCCAYRTRTGRMSCSTFGYRAVKRHGVVVGMLVLKRRFKKCSAAYYESPRPAQSHSFKAGYQAGYCDPPGLDCDPGHGCHGPNIIDVGELCSSCPCDLPCDLFDRKRNTTRRRRRENRK